MKIISSFLSVFCITAVLFTVSTAYGLSCDDIMQEVKSHSIKSPSDYSREVRQKWLNNLYGKRMMLTNEAERIQLAKELVQIVNSEKSSDLDKTAAAYLIGLFRLKEGVGTLVNNFMLCNIEKWDPDPMRVVVPAFPAQDALIAIGEPSIPGVMGIIETTTNSYTLKCGAKVILGIKGQEEGAILLQQAIADQTDSKKKENLKTALSSEYFTDPRCWEWGPHKEVTDSEGINRRSVRVSGIVLLVAIINDCIAGDAISAHVSLMNQSAAEMRINRGFRCCYDWLDISVKNQQGEKIGLTKYGSEILNDLDNQGRKGTITLVSGQQFPMDINLSRLFDLTKTGRYILSIKAEVSMGTNVINFNDGLLINQPFFVSEPQTQDPLNARGKDGWTPLMRALSSGDLAKVKVLIANCADVNAGGNGGWTPLMVAAFGSSSRHGRLDLVKFLVANGADVKARNKYGKTPLSLAAAQGHLDVVEFLKQHGATE
ncbi:MAG: ankyrin repeat domain-containing protein [Kiritimatiellae bacterium]|nr:ankyrin repeat domain-containing protein [Kiritimatiellia bacterium]